jgi:hypothetical protein
VRIVPAKNFAAVGTNDSIANAQSQSCAFANLFGREEWIEDPFGLA